MVGLVEGNRKTILGKCIALFLLISTAHLHAQSSVPSERKLCRELPVYSLKEPYGQIGALKQNADIYVLATDTNMARIRFRMSSNDWAEAQCHLTDLQTCLIDESLSKPIKPKRVTVAFSPRGEALELILEELSHAQSSVDVAMFTLSNHDLVDALCYLSEKRKIAVRYFADKESLLDTRLTVRARLNAAGVSIWVPDTFDAKMHLKCAVIDHKTVISGAGNWTEDAFNVNFEDTVFIESPELAQQFEAFFDEMMKSFTPSYESVNERLTPTPVQDFPAIYARPAYKNEKSVTMTELTAPLPKTFMDVASVSVYFAPRDNGMAETFALLRQATQDVTVAMFFVTSDDAMARLREMAQATNGPKLSLLIGGETLGPFSLRAYENLARSGVPVYYEAADLLMHMKATVLDNRYVATGSANWSDSAREKNCENIFIFESPGMADYYRAYIKEIMSCAKRIVPTELERSCGRVEKEKLMALDRPYPAISFTNRAWVKYVCNGDYFNVAQQLIQGAQQSVLVSMYLIPKTRTMPPRLSALLTALTAAAQRGVYVYVLLECPYYAGNPAEDGHAEMIDWLRQRGVDAHFDSPGVELHEKMMVVDGCKVLAGSHNWSEGSLSGNVLESGLLLVLPQPDLRLENHILEHLAIRNNEPAERLKEIQFHRQLLTMRQSERETFIRKLPTE